MKKIKIKGVRNNYNVIIRKNILNKVTDYLPSANKVAILTDNNIPFIYVETLKSMFNDCVLIVIDGNEKAKSFTNYQKCLEILLDNEFSKSDLLIAFGGGVVSDLAGFIASSFKRGIKFAIIPTTTLAMVDASIGSKNAINVGDIKNSVGSFYDPSIVLIDTTLLYSLPKKHYYNGLVEALKCGLIHDESLFNLLESNNYKIDDVIYKAILIKKYFIEKDPLDNNIRHALNFGHTYGHAYEALSNYKMLHGEAVANGILKVLPTNLVDRVTSILKSWKIKTDIVFDDDKVLEKIKQDKKIVDNKLSLVKVNTIGSYEIEDVNL